MTTTRLVVSRGSRDVAVDVVVDRPAEPIGGVVLIHGFARGPRVLDAITARLVHEGVAVVRPAIKSFGRRDGLTDPDFLAALAPGLIAALPSGQPFVVGGHSAGGAVAAWITAAIAAEDSTRERVRGLVLVDPNESLTPMLTRALRALSAAAALTDRVRVAAAEPGRCNRRGLGPRVVAEERPDALVVRMVGGTHCELEAEAADLACRTLCGGRSDVTRVDDLHRILVAWIVGLIDDEHAAQAQAVLDDLLESGRVVTVGGRG